ncbi:MAG: NAD-dependent epimerase/dehydratase [Belnapia sp.]|nr:NAD-dependent epimerase/dehydratase [Belnapia sp.]
MRILMTGHLGYIGTIAVPLMQAKGHDIIGCDTDLFAACTFGTDIGPAAAIPNIRLDIRDLTADHLAGFDAVMHLAALSNDPLGDIDADVTMDINAAATVSLARAAKRAGVPRFIFSSSCSNYGAAGLDLLDESASFRPVTPYGRSKVAAEQELALLADEHFSPVFMRSATAFGVSPRLRFDLFVNNLTAWAVATGEIYLKSDGTPWRAVVHIEDIARAFLAVAEAPREKIHLQAFNIGSSAENWRVIEVARMVAEVVPGARIRIADGAGPDLRCYGVNGDKLALAFPDSRPRWTTRAGVEQLYDAFSRHGVRPEDFEGVRYQRRAHVLSQIAAGRMSHGLRWQLDDKAKEVKAA